MNHPQQKEEKSTEYIKGYNAGKAYLSSIRKMFSKKIEMLENSLKEYQKGEVSKCCGAEKMVVNYKKQRE